jgi:hypothetical protein
LYVVAQEEAELITYADDNLPPDPSDSALLTRYTDGTHVPGATSDEFRAFHAFLRTTGTVPLSRAVVIRLLK